MTSSRTLIFGTYVRAVLLLVSTLVVPRAHAQNGELAVIQAQQILRQSQWLNALLLNEDIQYELENFLVRPKRYEVLEAGDLAGLPWLDVLRKWLLHEAEQLRSLISSACITDTLILIDAIQRGDKWAFQCNSDKLQRSLRGGVD